MTSTVKHPNMHRWSLGMRTSNKTYEPHDIGQTVLRSLQR